MRGKPTAAFCAPVVKEHSYRWLPLNNFKTKKLQVSFIIINRLNTMSKGSRQRPTNIINFDSSWDRIFGKSSQDEKKKGKKKAPLPERNEAVSVKSLH
tara:strand:+ start:83 stop:376 length:294 start_codon:yes stop_codon:yes gene_type:complete